MIQITLIVDGRSRIYAAAEVCMRTSLEAYRLFREYSAAGGDYSDDLLARCASFVCGCFGDVFTVDQLLDGYQGSAFALYPSLLNAVVGYVHDRIVNFPEPAAPATKAATPAN